MCINAPHRTLYHLHCDSRIHMNCIKILFHIDEGWGAQFFYFLRVLHCVCMWFIENFNCFPSLLQSHRFCKNKDKNPLLHKVMLSAQWYRCYCGLVPINMMHVSPRCSTFRSWFYTDLDLLLSSTKGTIKRTFRRIKWLWLVPGLFYCSPLYGWSTLAIKTETS